MGKIIIDSEKLLLVRVLIVVNNEVNALEMGGVNLRQKLARVYIYFGGRGRIA